MNIFADENMPLVEEFFADLGKVNLFNGRNVTAAQLADADILLVRSVTQVNSALLSKNKSLRFVGTATIGMDHIDQAYLQGRGIRFSSAPGCNAQSVVEYMLSSIWLLAERYQWQLTDKTVGIVGVGNIGSRLARALTALNVPVLLCDPVRSAQQADFAHTDFQALCQQADVLCFHTPLVKTGLHPTYHLLNRETLNGLKSDCAILNASRGAVIDNNALLQAQQDVKRPLVLDVWETEPNILLSLLPYCDLATAHIAGHSIEGKARGTEMLYQRCCELLNLHPAISLQKLLPVPAMEKLQISTNFGLPDVQSVARMLYDVRRDDALFRHHIEKEGFDWLRKSYPARREFSALQLVGPAIPAWLGQLGFNSQI